MLAIGPTVSPFAASMPCELTLFNHPSWCYCALCGRDSYVGVFTTVLGTPGLLSTKYALVSALPLLFHIPIATYKGDLVGSHHCPHCSNRVVTFPVLTVGFVVHRRSRRRSRMRCSRTTSSKVRLDAARC